MTGDRWTLLLLKGEESPVRQYSISRRTVHFAIGGVTALFFGVGGLSMAMGMDGTARLRARSLAEKNEALAGELVRIQSKVEGLEGRLGDLSEKGAELRALAGLDAIEEDILAVGVGGPGLSTPESNPLYGLDEKLGETAFAVTYDLNALERRARLLSLSLAEATDSLEAHHDLLESTPSILPTSGLLSSVFSQRRYHPIHHRPLPHEGVDISAPKGTAIMAAAKGVVRRAGWYAGYGLMVEIDHGYGFSTRYGHASKVLVRVGQTVERADVVAQVGSTGIATSSHLHYEVRVNGQPQNPLNYVLQGAVP